MSTIIPVTDRHAWRASQKLKAALRTFYGWRLVPVFRTKNVTVTATDAVPEREIVGTTRVWSHPPGSLLVGAPKRTGGEGSRYLVTEHRNLRRITKRLFDALAPLPVEKRIVSIVGKTVETE